MKLEISHQFSKNTLKSNFMKIRPVGAELFHADGRTDMTKLIVVFRNFANAPKNQLQDTSNTAYILYRYQQLHVSANQIATIGLYI